MRATVTVLGLRRRASSGNARYRFVALPKQLTRPCGSRAGHLMKEFRLQIRYETLKGVVVTEALSVLVDVLREVNRASAD
jgi:hypothetical protein